MRICVRDAAPLVGFYSVVKIQIMGSGSASMQSRLIDYLVVVGVRKPTVMEFVLMCFYLVRALFTRKKRLQRKNSNSAAEVST